MEIKEMPDFESVVNNEPLILLSRIENLMHNPFLTLIEVLFSLLNVKQGDNEDLLDYLSRFRSEKDVVMRLLDHKLIDGYVERLPEYMSLLVTDTAGR